MFTKDVIKANAATTRDWAMSWFKRRHEDGDRRDWQSAWGTTRSFIKDAKKWRYALQLIDEIEKENA